MKDFKKNIPISAKNVLVVSHLWNNNTICQDYCAGIKANSDDYSFIDYLDLYTQSGKKKSEIIIQNLIVEKRINYIFFILGSSDLTFDIYIIEKLSKSSFIAMNFFDTEYYFESVDRYYAQAADLVILPDYLSKFKYELLNINALCTFSLFSKDRYSVANDLEKNIDVSFVGNLMNKNRKEYIGYLTESNVKVQSFGEGSLNGYVDFLKMVNIFGTSKINLNFTNTNGDLALFSLKINSRIKQCKGRPIEAALAGGFVLSEYAPGIENMFEIGREIDVFHTKEELLKKIKYYLENEEEREVIAKRGHERALRDYDAQAAFAKIFSNIDRYKKVDSNIYLDSNFVANYATFRFLYMGLFLLNKKYKNMFEEVCLFLKYRKINYRSLAVYLRYLVSVFLYRHRKIKNILKKVLGVSKRSGTVNSKAELTI